MVTQQPPVQNAEIVQGEDQLPSADTRDGLLESSSNDLLSAGLTTPPADGDAGDEGDAPAGTDAAAAAEGQGRATPAKPAQATAPPDAKMVDYVSMLAAAPQRASEVPERVRIQAVQAAAQIRAAIVQQRDAEILASIEEFNTQQAAIGERVGPFTELREAGDVEALADLEQSDPEGARLYHEQLAAQAAARAPQPTLPVEVVALKARATELFESLATDDARARITANYQAGKYPTSEDGLAALRADVQAESASPRAVRSPAARAAAATARAALPRVEASVGAAPLPARESAKDLLAKSSSDLLAEGLAS